MTSYTEDAVHAASYTPDAVGMDDPRTPSWFQRAVSEPYESGEVEVEGACIRYLTWPGGVGPATLLVHGGSAHAQWWAPLAPLLRTGGPVVAMDLSGHGRSDWRPSGYTVAQWGREVRAVADATTAGPPTLIAHSMGGIVAAHLAVTAGEFLGRLVVVDAPVWNGAPAPEGEVAARAKAPVRYHADPELPIARFRLIPKQDCANDWYLRHVAWHGLVATSGGYRWRFDARIFAGTGGGSNGENRIARFEGSLAESACPFAVVMGEESYLAPHARDAFGDPQLPSESGQRRPPLILVPSARHHVMLDQPLALAATLRSLLTVWH